jgi:DNA-directed RNA polymerase subunit RPC12/RpoP
MVRENRCPNCGDIVDGGNRYCCSDCRRQAIEDEQREPESKEDE